MKKPLSKWYYYALVLVAWIVYILLTLSAGAAQSTRQVELSDTTLQILRATLLLPYMLTWLIAITGWYHFRQFAADTKRKNIPAYPGFRNLSRGLGLLIFDLILMPMFSAARNAFGENPDYAAVLTVINNYTHIVIPLFAFGFLYVGSQQLASGGHYATTIRTRMLPALVSTALFVALFIIAVFNNTSRQIVAESGRFASYYISDSLIILTIIFPLAMAWFMGIQATLNIERYVHSLLLPKWRKAIVYFFHGLLAIVSSSIILQAITAFGSQQLQQINIFLLLVIIYIFIFLQAAGYLYIRKSAKLLDRLIKVGTPDETN